MIKKILINNNNKEFLIVDEILVNLIILFLRYPLPYPRNLLSYANF